MSETTGGSAVFFDGISSRRRPVEINFAETLEIIQAGSHLASWQYPSVRIVDAPVGTTRLSCTDAPALVRIEFRHEALRAEIERRCPNLTGPGGVQPVSAGRIAAWSMSATAVIVAMIWFGVPILADQIAEMLPFAWERPLGQAVERQVRTLFPGKECTKPGGVAALNKMVAGLQAAAHLPLPPDPVVIESPIPNAFALPGGRIYVLSGLLDKTAAPDELAGVLAHEFGHVAHRDGLRRLIRDGGTGFLVGLLFGDISGAGPALFVVRSLLNAAYSREVEEGADSFAITTMHRLGRPTTPLGRLLTRIAGPSEPAFSILSDHPMTPDRARRLERPYTDTLGAPLLNWDEWTALRAICH